MWEATAKALRIGATVFALVALLDVFNAFFAMPLLIWATVAAGVGMGLLIVSGFFYFLLCIGELEGDHPGMRQCKRAMFVSVLLILPLVEQITSTWIRS